METGRSSGGRKQTELLTELNAAAKGTHFSVRRSSMNDQAEGTLASRFWQMQKSRELDAGNSFSIAEICSDTFCLVVSLLKFQREKR